MLKKLLAKLKKHPLAYGGVILVLIVIIAISIFGGGDESEQTMIATRGEFLSEVSASGKVIAAQSSNLGFDQSGRVAGVYAQVGDTVLRGSTLASIENGTIRADITQKQANLEKERANLVSLKRGTRPEQLALTQQKYSDASSALSISMKDAYLKTENAILSQADTIFEHGNGANPRITIATQNDTEEKSIQSERIIVGEKLSAWNEQLKLLPASPTASAINTVRAAGTDAMSYTRSFLDRLGGIASRLSVAGSGMTQSEIDLIRTTINAAGQAASTAVSAEQASYASWTVASNNLSLEKSGSTPEDIAAQEAQVKAAEADLISAEAQLRKTLVIAPFDGIVTKMDVKIGEISSPSVSSIAMIGSGLYEIESYIPEVNIARLSVNNPATITLDAYGSDIEFPATVIAIDPAETIRDGVSTYKTRLQFAENDPRIKPGMTANIRITTEKKAGAIVIPRSIIAEKNGQKTVRIKVGDEIREVSVQTGSMTPLGQIEITSGISEGDIIVLPALIP
ncbi:MAG: efflux RND transporter periplasmic adaptor subunit [Patescibacteria group bacterium]